MMDEPPPATTTAVFYSRDDIVCFFSTQSRDAIHRAARHRLLLPPQNETVGRFSAAGGEEEATHSSSSAIGGVPTKQAKHATTAEEQRAPLRPHPTRGSCTRRTPGSVLLSASLCSRTARSEPSFAAVRAKAIRAKRDDPGDARRAANTQTESSQLGKQQRAVTSELEKYMAVF